MIANQLERWANERAQKIALQIKRNGRYESITFAKFWDRCLSAAAALKDSGIRTGDSIALFAENSPEWVIAYLGIHLSGAVAVPIDAQYGTQELETLLSFSRSKAVVVDEERCREVDKFLEKSQSELRVWLLDYNDPKALVNVPSAEDFHPYAHSPEDLMSILFTSGTTGDPKGVQLTCGNINSNIEGILKAIEVSDKDNLLNILPLHHAYSSTVGLFVPLMAGATVTFCRSLKGPDLMATMQETGVTILPGVPQLFTLFDRAIFQKIDSAGTTARMLFWTLYTISKWVRNTTGLLIGRFFFGKVHRQFGRKFRFCASGGAKLDRQVSERFLNLGILILEGYGLTETSPVISFTPLSKPTPGGVGLPLEGIEVRIDSPDSNGVGEICMRGPNLMKGYYLNKSATNEVIREGWFYTGDLGYIRDGMITITGRAKEVIVLSSGKNIYPEEVEKHYENTPLVKEVCVMPVEGADGQVERLCMVVVPDYGELAARHVANVRERIQSELAIIGCALPSYMRITDLVLFDGEFPRTRLGKLRRSKIAEQMMKQRQSGHETKTVPIFQELMTLMEDPASKRFLKRLDEVTGVKGPFSPDQDLAMDLGIDSLSQIQLGVVLEEEFGVKIPDEELSSVRTVGDILKRIAKTASTGAMAETGLSWSRRLAEPPEIPLDKLFNLERGIFSRSLVRILKGFLAPLVRLFFRAKIEGLDKIPKSGAVLICPNHQSYIDPLLLYALLPAQLINRLLFVAYEEVFRRPPLSWIIRFGRLILTGGAGTMAESLKLSYRGLQRGMAVCIFPEGGRTTTGKIMKPRLGVGILSCETKVPIVPVLIEGTVKTLSPQEPRFRFCKVRLVIGNPIEPPMGVTPAMEDYQSMVDRWEEVMLHLQGKGIDGLERKP